MNPPGNRINTENKSIKSYWVPNMMKYKNDLILMKKYLVQTRFFSRSNEIFLSFKRDIILSYLVRRR